MKTSYKNCHPEIAESLQRGEHIKCFVGNETHQKATIIAYRADEKYENNMYISTRCTMYHTATPIKSETYVISAVEMMKGLVERGYTIDSNGTWNTKGKFPQRMWHKCGKPVCLNSVFEPWMLEEREVE